MTTIPARRSILALSIVAATALAACSGAASPSTARSIAPSGDPAGPTSSAAPPIASSHPGDSAVGGGSAGDPGSGVGPGVPQDPNPVDPIGGQQPVIVQPLPGRLNPHPVAPVKLEASLDERHLFVKVSWYGGVEPCSVLDSIRVTRSGFEIAVVPFEGASDVRVACIDIAMLKATIVDLGEPDPGTWRISSPGSDAPPVEVTIP
jgi:hypothetical protein